MSHIIIDRIYTPLEWNPCFFMQSCLYWEGLTPAVLVSVAFGTWWHLVASRTYFQVPNACIVITSIYADPYLAPALMVSR